MSINNSIYVNDCKQSIFVNFISSLVFDVDALKNKLPLW